MKTEHRFNDKNRSKETDLLRFNASVPITFLITKILYHMKTFRLFPIFLLVVLNSCEPTIVEPPATFKLTTTASPEVGGKITYSPFLNSFYEGRIVTVTPEPNENWVFQRWEGDTVATTNPLTLKMNSNKSIVGVFVKKNYDLAFDIVGEGTVTEVVVENPSGREFPHGTIVELTPVPKEGWVFESWQELDPKSNSGFGPFIISNDNPKRTLINGPKYLTVTFVPKPNGEPRFFLAENGITCKCDYVISGQKGILNGIEFEAVNNALLRQKVEEKADLTRLCTSMVTDMSGLFNEKEPNQAIGNWDVSNVIDMSKMFAGSGFNQPIEYWDVSNVKTMEGMFSVGNTGFSVSLFNQPIGDWDVSKVSNMDFMFYDNEGFNQDLSKWCVVKIPIFPRSFYNNSAWTLPKPVWGTCPD